MKTAHVGWLPLLVVTLWAATAVADETLTDATTGFTVDLLKKVFPQEQGNFIMSPISVSTLLAMVQQGAKNSSATQLNTVLRLTKEQSKAGYKEVLLNFQKRKYKSKLTLGNKMFVSPDFDVIPAYDSVLHTNFDTISEKVDFKQPAVAAGRINEWVSYASNRRIKELVTQDLISARTQMVLTNVIYFKGVWSKTFARERTVPTEFRTSADYKVQTPMMSMKELLRSGEDPDLGAKWVELSYDGDDFSMILVLPTQDYQLSDVVARMTQGHLKNMMNTRVTKDVTLKMPKFKLSGEIKIVGPLKQLGLTDIFDQRSNLEGISTSKGPLIVSDVLHKAEIEVNEEGTEASAASAIFVNTLSLAPEYEAVEFSATQPFLAIIMDKVNAMPLFVARVSDPTLT